MKRIKKPLESKKVPLWDLGIEEVTGHNIEVAGREEVNALLKKGWILLHIYTLSYKEDGIWRQRPMAILGKPLLEQKQKEEAEEQEENTSTYRHN